MLVVRFGLSVFPGEDEDSSSLLGISIMAFAEITGSLLVLYRWKFKGASPAGGTGESANRRSDQLQEVKNEAGKSESN